MPTPEQDKNVLDPTGATDNTESTELMEDDLKAVSGGLPNTMGAGLTNTGVCVSTD